MQEYIIITEGYTESPNGEALNNCQMLGIAEGKTRAEAIAALFAAESWLAEAGFTPEACVDYALNSNKVA